VTDRSVELGEADAHGKREGNSLRANPWTATSKAPLRAAHASRGGKYSDSYMSANSSLILASASPRRRELLARLGVPFTVIPAEVVEHEAPDADPRQMVAHNAALKAEWIAERHPDATVLG